MHHVPAGRSPSVLGWGASRWLPARHGLILGMVLASLVLVLEAGISAACEGPDLTLNASPTAQSETPAGVLRRLTVQVQFVGTPGVAPGPGVPEPRPVSLGVGRGATVQIVDPAAPGLPVQTMLADDQGNAVFMLPPGTWRVVVPEGGQGSALAGATILQSATPHGTSALAWTEVTVTTDVDADVILSMVVALV